MAFWVTIRLRYAVGDHCGGLHGGRLSTRRGTERVENDSGNRGCCGLNTRAYDGSADFDFHNIAYKFYASTARQFYPHSSCGSNGFHCTGAHEC